MGKIRKILVVGGAGYIGGHVVDYLLYSSSSAYTANDVMVYDNLMFEQRYLKNVKFVHGDIRERYKLLKTINDYNPDVVIWLAALVGDGACQLNPKLSEELNYDSVVWLASNTTAKIVFSSTCSVYGKNDAVLDERSEVNPLSVYAETKLKAEQFLIRNRPDSLIFRLGTLYGIGDSHSRLRFDLVANVLSLKAAKNEKITVFGGEQWRPLLNVKDVATAIHRGLTTWTTGLYNLVDTNTTIKDLAIQIKSITKSDSEIVITDMPFEDQRNYKVDGSKYRLVSAWKPTYTLDNGVMEIYNAVKENRIVNPYDPLYSNVQYMQTLEEFKK